MENNLHRFWLAMFSQSGSEIVEISKNLGRFPDKIITNKIDLSRINSELLAAVEKHKVELVQIINPTVEDYRFHIPYGALVTLNGYLKIIPPEICDEYDVYNGHPGDIVAYPELKGKDPQEKAVELRLPTTGCVIHECTKDLDSGKILLRETLTIPYYRGWFFRYDDDVVTEMLIKQLHNLSVTLWTEFLTFKLDFDNEKRSIYL